MSFPILSVMIALPLLAALGCLFLKADGARWLALGATLALFVLGCLWIRRKPLWVIPLPFVAAAIWLGGMSAGEAWLGWTP